MSFDLADRASGLELDKRTADETLVESNQLMHTTTPMPSNNACDSPLLGLPHELLESILTYVAKNENVQQLVLCGQICSSLRALSLGLQCLWGDAVWSSGSEDLRRMIIERAGPTAPLRLRVIQGLDDPNATQFAMEHLQRVRVIFVQHPVFAKWFVEDTDHSCLPYLEEVNIDTWGPSSAATLAQTPKETPCLKHVKLCNLVWAFVPSRALTSLKIECHPANRGYTPSQFLDLLRQSSHLQNLILGRCLPYLTDSVVSEARISLLYLRQLIIGDAREYALALWRVLSVSPDTKVSCYLYLSATSHLSRINYRGPPYFEDAVLFKKHLKCRQPVVLLFTETGDNELGFIVSSGPKLGIPRGKSQTTRSDLEDTLTLIYEFRESELPEHMLSIRRAYTALDLPSSIECLSWRFLTRAHLNAADDWPTVLQDFQNVTSMEVSLFTRVLCNALGSLAPASTSTDSAESPPLLLSKLRELNVGFGGLVPEESVQTFYPTKAMFFEMMHKRTVQGSPLDTLDIRKLTVWPEDKGTSAKDLFLKELRFQFPDCRINLE